MKIAKHHVVLIDYKLTDPEGNLIDSSEGGRPLAYIHGIGNLIPGLEKALEGNEQGAAFSVTIPPEEGYGVRDESLVQPLPRDRFAGLKDLAIGTQLQAQTEVGRRIVRVVALDDETVTIDANHELAGLPLHFDVKVVEIRNATADELDHGHVHGPGGHHH